MKRHLAALLMSAAALSLLCGCGYRIGTMGHPQIHTIAIAPVKNDTTVYNLAWILRNVLVEQFMLDGTLKAVDEKKADCILYARIVSSSVRVVAEKHKYDRTPRSAPAPRKQPLRKDLQEPLFAQAGKRSSQEARQASLPQGKIGLTVPGGAGCQSV